MSAPPPQFTLPLPPLASVGKPVPQTVPLEGLQLPQPPFTYVPSYNVQALEEFALGQVAFPQYTSLLDPLDGLRSQYIEQNVKSAKNSVNTPPPPPRGITRGFSADTRKPGPQQINSQYILSLSPGGCCTSNLLSGGCGPNGCPTPQVQLRTYSNVGTLGKLQVTGGPGPWGYMLN